MQRWGIQTAVFLVCLCFGLGLILTPPRAEAQSNFYDEYGLIGYEEKAVDNPIARLLARLESGETSLEWNDERGYLDSLLEQLSIDFSSQILVFSKTSLQYQLISWDAPRAIYFNDDTYVAWVQDSNIVEMTTYDERLGAIFYLFHNERNKTRLFDRENQRCLVCHDSSGSMGGGVPLLMVRSSIIGENGVNLQDRTGGINITDRSPIDKRWGGWFVTGQSGQQQHLGNIQLPGRSELPNLDDYRVDNIDTLEGQGLLDTAPFPVKTSDIVALMILEHQVTVQNQLTYIRFKAPAVLGRMGLSDALDETSWEAMSEKAQHTLTRMLDDLVDVMLLKDATTFSDTISGSKDYETWFLSQGVRDEAGHSLRELDLETRLFRYPLSYLIYSPEFDTLPSYALDYVYQRLAAVLQGDEDSHLTEDERSDILSILRDTKPDFLPYLD